MIPGDAGDTQEADVKFLISMADVEDEWDSLSQAERERVGACHVAFQRELGARYIGCWAASTSSRPGRWTKRSSGRKRAASGRVRIR
jgi:hypothetical protein